MSYKIPEIGLARLLERFAPLTIPNKTFARDNGDLLKVTTWNKTFAVAVLAGLSTEVRFHANGIRFDWLQRLVLTKAGGKRKPTSKELERALNSGLSRANVLGLEDPNEDLFCDLIATKQGSFRIFPGQWESAAAYTQTLLETFEALPSGPPKQDALTAVYALLRLSDEIASRAGVERGVPSGGRPFGDVLLPDYEGLKRLARRVHFSALDLERLGIEGPVLSPFLLDPKLYPFVRDREIGDTPLELRPVLSVGNGITVASPANLSLAVRAVLVNTARSGGMGEALHVLSTIKEATMHIVIR